MKRTVSILYVLIASSVAFGAISMHAHRGEPHKAPENSVESIKLAFDLGAQMIETDVNLTKEGRLVIMHGRRELKKVWGIDKPVEELTLEDLKNSKPAHPEDYDPKYANAKIPTFDELLKVIPKDKRFELEIKVYGADFARKVVEALKRAGLTEKNVLITCFRPEVIADFKKQYPQFETMYICGVGKDKDGKLNKTPEQIIANAKQGFAGEVAIGGYKNIDRAFVKKIQDAGIKVAVWQVENLDDLDYAVQLGATRVCSNNAHKLREAYKRIHSLDFK
ncbi:MAG: hypothetical protein IJI37_05140 [Opitutales bacterium]|nr:hypothetical protein [Opitutales bacterium]